VRASSYWNQISCFSFPKERSCIFSLQGHYTRIIRVLTKSRLQIVSCSACHL
jgi:hypothetical protein